MSSFYLIYIFFVFLISQILPLKLASGAITGTILNFSNYQFLAAQFVRLPVYFLGRAALPVSLSIFLYYQLQSLGLNNRLRSFYSLIYIYLNPLVLYWLATNLRDMTNIMLITFLSSVIVNLPTLRPNFLVISRYLLCLCTLALISFTRVEQSAVFIFSLIIFYSDHILQSLIKLVTSLKVNVVNLLVFIIVFYTSYNLIHLAFVDIKVFSYNNFLKFLELRAERALLGEESDYISSTFTYPSEVYNSIFLVWLKGFIALCSGALLFPAFLTVPKILAASIVICYNYLLFIYAIFIKNKFSEFIFFLKTNPLSRLLMLNAISYLLLTAFFNINFGNAFRNSINLYYPISLVSLLFITRSQKIDTT